MSQTNDISFNFEKASILMIDANALCLDVMTGILSGFGFRRIIRCSDMQSGIDAAKKHTIDIILIDPSAFGEEAFNLIKWLRSEQRNPNSTAPVLIISGHTSVRLITSTRQCGADYVIAKPFSTSCLLDRILWVAASETRRGSELMTPANLVSATGSGVEMW